MVGLWNRMDYGERVNRLLESGGPERKEEQKQMTVTVTSPDGGPVNLRKAAKRTAPLADRILPGTEAELLESGNGWSKIRASGRTGCIMTEFLVTDESAAPAGEMYSVIISGLDRVEAQAVCGSYPGRSRMEVSRG